MILIIYVVGGLIALIVLALVFLPALIDEQAVIELAQQQVRQATGGELSVAGDLDLNLFPEFKLNLGATTIDLPPQGAGGSRLVATAQEVDIGLAPLALLSGADEVGDIRLTGADVKIFDNSDVLQTQVTLSQLSVEGLNIADQPMVLRGGITVSGDSDSEPLVIDFDGTVRVPKSLDRVTLVGLDTRITGALSEPVSTELSGIANLSPLNADLDLTVNTPGGAIEGDLIYSDSGSPQIDLDFRSKRLDLDRLQSASTERGSEETDEASGTPEASVAAPAQAPPLPLPVGPLRDLDLRLKISAGELVSAGQTVGNAQLLVRVVDGITTLEYLRGVLHEGQLDARMTVDVREPTVKVALTGGLKGVEMNSLLTSIGKSETAAGYVDMDWDIDTRGETAMALQTGLDGDLNVQGRNVEITSVSAQKLICSAIAQIQQTTLSNDMPATTKISALSARVRFVDGQAQLSPLNLGTQGIALSGDGAASLETLDFAATLKAQVNDELEALDKACRVDERYAGLDLPVNCAGNLTDETGNLCRVDVEDIARQLLEREARSKLEAEANKLGEKAGNALKKLFGN